MRFQSTVVAAALATGALADIEFDLDDAPRECRDICRPVEELSRQCEVDLRGDNNDREEDQLEAQCFCTNDSFNVGDVSALCHDCIRQVLQKHHDNNGNNNNNNNNSDEPWLDDDDDDDDDDDEWEDYADAHKDLRDILRTCGFSTTSYASAQTSMVDGITVSAARPTDVDQLTTTFSRGPMPTGGNNDNNNGGGGGSGNNNNDDNNDDNNNDSSNNNNNNDNNNNDDNNDDDDDAAGALKPFYLAGAIAAGVMALV